MKLKPKKHWKHNASIMQGRSSGGTIRWKGAGERDGTDRFLVIVDKNRGKPDYFRRSESIEGSAEDALALLRRFLQEAEQGSGLSKTTSTPFPEDFAAKESMEEKSSADSAGAGFSSFQTHEEPVVIPVDTRSFRSVVRRRVSPSLRVRARSTPRWMVGAIAFVLGAIVGSTLTRR